MSLPRRAIPWCAGGLAIVVVADVLALVLQHSGRAVEGRAAQNALRLPSAPAVARHVAAPTPRILTRYGQTFTVTRVPAEAARRDRVDPATVDVFVSKAFSQDSASCLRQVEPSVHVVAETDTYVLLATFAYRLPAPGGLGTYSCSFASGPGVSGEARLPVRLAKPLATRTLWDLASGRAIAVLTADDPPAPRYLPPGYRPLDLPAGIPDDEPIADRSYVKGADHVSIDVSSASTWQSPPRVIRTAAVREHPAIVAEAHGTRCIDWAENSGRVYEICSGGKDGALDANVLLGIARSMP